MKTGPAIPAPIPSIEGHRETQKMTKHLLNGSAAVIQRVLSGRSVAQQLRHLDERQRGCLAANVLDGLVRYQPTARSLSREFRVSERYIRAGQCLSPQKREAVINRRDSTPFAVLLNPSEPTLALPAPKPVTDDDLVHLAHLVGADRWLHAAAEAGI
jgi:hypothetical protein